MLLTLLKVLEEGTTCADGGMDDGVDDEVAQPTADQMNTIKNSAL